MKTILLLLKSRFLVVCALFINIMFYSQETLATFQFNNTLAANPAPVPIGSPVLAFKNSSGTVTPAAYENGFWFGWGSRMLYTSENNSNVELTIDTTNKYGITIEWYGELDEGYNEKGTWSVEILKSGVWTTVPNSTMNLQNKPVLIFFPSQDRETKTVTLEPYADNNANLQIRIKASGLNDKIRIDNLIITSRSPKINVLGYNTTNTLTQIPVNSPAASLYGTDFGIVITSSLTATGYADRVFRIQNNGAATLNISAINFTGDNPADFAVTGTFPATVNAGTTKDFTVRFNAASDGKSSALLNIVSNANPSPYSYYVEGRGASCKSEDLVFKSNTMESTTQTLAATPAAGSLFDKVSGNSALPNSLITRLYGPDQNTDYNLYTSLNNSWYVRGRSSTVNFGSVDVTSEKGVFITFNLAAFSTANNVVFGTNDKVTLEVLDPTTNLWSKEVEIVGNGANNNNSHFAFTTGSLLEGTYDGDNIPIGGTVKASSIKLKLLGSSDFTNLAFRITATTNDNNKLWLIDDVSVSTANAVFKTYTADGWRNSANDPTTVPGLEEKAIINAPFTDNLTACECEVLPDKSVSLPSGKLITLEGKLDNKGTFTIESDGNLIQNDNRAVNSGNITVKRVIKVGALRDQYNYLGTPVNFASGESFKRIYPGTTDVLYHNEANNRFYNSSGVNVPGRGLALKEPTGSGITTVTANYKGVPQNGKIVLPVTNSNTDITTLGYNLVGNPYPSNIDLLKLYSINGGQAKGNISSTFYFWDNKGNTETEQQGSGYSGEAYATYNALTGNNGTGTSANQLGSSKKPTNIVKVGQGFMTRSLKRNYDFLFDNGIRIKDYSAIDFLGKEKTKVQDDRYWLHLTAPSGITSTIAIVHYAGGNNVFGPEDSRSMGGSDALYSIVESEKIAIDGRRSFADTDIIPLGTKHFASGDFIIGLDEKEGIFTTGQNIYLKDTQTGIITNLSEGNYTFQANAGESTGRFEIIYRPETVLITDNIIKDVILVYRADDKFVIKSPKSIAMVQVYDLSGKMITVLKPNSKEAIVEASYLIKGIYVLRINTVDGEITNKKIIKH